MTAAEALEQLNRELRSAGQPPVVMDEAQMHRAFASLCAYSAGHQRPLDVAISDLVRYHIYEQAVTQPADDLVDPREQFKLILREKVTS